MNIDTASSSLVTPAQQRNESKTNETDTQTRQLQEDRQSSTSRSDNTRAEQTTENARAEAREDRTSEFALNQNRPISSLATSQDTAAPREQASTQAQEQANQGQQAARRREQIEQEISSIQNPNQGQPRLSIEV